MRTLIFILLIIAAGCASPATRQDSPTATPTLEAAPTATPSPTPEPSPTPVPTNTPVVVSMEQLDAAFRGAMAFVEDFNERTNTHIFSHVEIADNGKTLRLTARDGWFGLADIDKTRIAVTSSNAYKELASGLDITETPVTVIVDPLDINLALVDSDGIVTVYH